MKTHPAFQRPLFFVATLLLGAALLPARASDHADPMSINVFAVQESPEANITDLHAFVVDRNGVPIRDANRIGEGDQLIISLSVRRALQPQQISALQLKGYKFRVHLDLDPSVRFFDETKTRTGENYEAALQAAGARPGALISEQQTDRSMQALYGGIITHPDAIAENAVLEFELDLVPDGENSQSILANYRIEGIPGDVNIVSEEKIINGVVRIQKRDWKTGAINIQTGVFDDPFIFPRFFRRNVVGIVISIPLSLLPADARNGPILLWATTHRGKQIDHVGRSLRTQLPRFGYLNDKLPSEQVQAIMGVHDRPSIENDLFATFVSPLFAHRHYDSAPDVMIYDLRKPASFPNGRQLDDDVSETLAEAGETLLLELAYAESRQFPRAATNDKKFRDKFPYLALRWTDAEIRAHAQPGTMMDDFPVAQAPDRAAIAAPNFRDYTWRTFWRLELGAIAVLTLLLLFTVRTNIVRGLLVALAVVAIWFLHFVGAPNLPPTDPAAMAQPARKLCRLISGGVLVTLLTLGWVFALGRRCGAKYREPEPFPPGNQGLTDEDQPVATDSYEDVKAAVFSQPYYGKAWGGPERMLLPIYKQTLGSILRGLFPLGKRLFLQAAKRTVISRADLRWGPDRKGFRRLLHPMGICLTGTWKITGAPAGTAYTGYFAKGAEGRIIGRYSNGGSKPWGGHYRSLSLIGKIYPPKDSPQPPEAPAHFFTQEDLGSTVTNSIREAIMTNSPPITPWNRGKDIFFLIVNGLTLLMADTKNSERQLYQVAELGKPEGTPTSCPRFMRLTVSKETPQVGGDGADFRDEILGIIYDRGNPKPQRKLIFNIEVSDSGKKHGFGIEWLTDQHWTGIGKIIFEDAVASYNSDFVIHFHHPVWRNERNDPESIARPNLRS